MNDPAMMAQMMAAQQGQGPSDEEMLEQVRMGMGNQEGPPPGSGMKWQNLEDDQAALINDPNPQNIQAFVQYWGQENLPPGLIPEDGGGQGGPPAPPQMGEEYNA